ncbi:hypothetical protein BKA93DRAFT_441722 [Sparassis latifolia]
MCASRILVEKWLVATSQCGSTRPRELQQVFRITVKNPSGDTPIVVIYHLPEDASARGAPITRVSPEILRLIFVLGYLSLNGTRKGFVDSIASVCRQWQTIALDISFLWTQ